MRFLWTRETTIALLLGTTTYLGGFLAMRPNTIKLEDIVDVRAAQRIEQEEPTDYCKENDLSPVEQVRAGVQVKASPLLLQNTSTPTILDKYLLPMPPTNHATYNVTAIPVGYDARAIRAKMPNIVAALRIALKGVNARVTSIDHSIPLPQISHVEHLVFQFSNAQLFLNVKQIHGADRILFFLNTPEFIGNTHSYPQDNLIGFIGGNTNNTLYLAAHEVGHLLGLTDGYSRHFSRAELLRNSLELFLKESTLRPYAQQAYNTLRPPIIDTGNTCNGEPVYTFSDQPNVMTHSFTDQDYIDGKIVLETQYTPFQKAVMNEYIKQSRKRL